MRARMAFARHSAAREASPRVYWQPTDLGAALKAWWHAGDHGTPNMVDDGAGLISSWKDRIAAIDVVATTTARPTWAAASFNAAFAGVTFDGVANTLRGTTLTGLPVGATSGEIFAAASATAGGANRQVVNYGGISANLLRRLQDVSDKLRASDGSVLSDSLGSLVPLGILCGIFTATTVQSRLNGVDSAAAAGAAVNTGTTRIAIGANNNTAAGNFWVGAIRHVLITAALTATQREQLEGWLAWDANMVALLPASHPYKGVAP